MDFTFPDKLSGRVKQTVKFEDTAAKYGSGLVEVFATPALVALMEKTCHESCQPFLPPGFNTVGIEVNITHIKATPVGMMVTCDSELIKTEGKRLTFRVIAQDEEGEIGSGTHVRYIINAVKFMEKLKKQV
jgi:fluoroacetyl-CoA thioesterase